MTAFRNGRRSGRRLASSAAITRSTDPGAARGAVAGSCIRFSSACARLRLPRVTRCSVAAVGLAVVGIIAWHGAAHAAETAASADAALAMPPPFKAPYLPASDAEELQDVPSTRDPAVLEMKALRGKLDAAPGSLPAAIQLADAYVDYGRQIGDAHYAGYAEAVIAPWTTAAAPPARALVTQATIVQYRHQFRDARGLLQRALRLDPRNAQAWLTLATLDMVQGDYPSAGTECAQVTANAGFELGLVCAASLHSYTGQARQSLVILEQAATTAGKAAAAYQAWVQGLLAETAERLGDWPLAESHYLDALRLLPRDNFLLVAYADFLLDRARPQEVLKLLADRAQSDTAFLRLALAQAALHSAEVPRYTWIMAARFEALTLRGSDYFGREQARFALELQHDPQTALAMALRNWQVQREPWDTRLVLQAALAAQQPQAAADVLEFLRNTKLQDPVIEPLARDLRARLTRSSGAGG
jgi:Tfp pilus assembly protein PilF